MTIKTAIQIIVALLAFAANSVLCRLALNDTTIDALSFTWLRVVSGALALLLLTRLHQTTESSNTPKNQSWIGAFALLTYCGAFSFSYHYLGAGLGALVLFGTVQIVIISASLWRKENTGWSSWIGVVMALSGFGYLFVPDPAAAMVAPTQGLLLMILAGCGWAIYTLHGRGSTTPLLDTKVHFIRASWLCVPLLLGYVFLPTIAMTPMGILLAITSGAITSGLGYAVWYAVLPALSRLQAGVVQLCVPVVAALGGIVLIGEAISTEFVIAAVLLLGGVLVTLAPTRVRP